VTIQYESHMRGTRVSPRGSVHHLLRRASICLAMSLVASIATDAAAAVSPAARAALINFYNSTNGPSWTQKTGWNGAAGTECSWFGITCDAGQTNVTAIQLGNNNLVGNVVPAFGAGDDLGSLETLDLSNNPGLASAPIPDFSALTELQVLWLSNDRLSGTFPDLAPLANLQSALFDGNELKGQITSVVNLPDLIVFSAASNHLTGALPELSLLQNLIAFDVHANFFSGQIPKLPSGIAYIDVSENQLSGTLPILATLQSLSVFSAERNQLIGPIPPLPASMTEFLIAANRFSGQVAVAPNGLFMGASTLCPNQLIGQANAAWDLATGHTPWDGNGCNSDPYDHLTLEKDLIKVRPGQASNLLASGESSVAENDLILAPTTSLTQLSPVIHGSVDLKNPDGTFKYRDSDGVDDWFLYWHCDGLLDCAGAKVEIFVDANTPPIAAWDSIAVAKGGTATTLIGGAASVLANDRDDDGDLLFAGLVRYPTAGTLRLNADGTFVYVNTKQNAVGDSFEYMACDKWSECSIAMVGIAIGAPPPDVKSPIQVVDDEIEVLPNGSTNVLTGGAGSVLLNDTDLDGNTLVAKKLTDPVNGDVQIDLAGTFTYTNTYPSAASDSFAYQACDQYEVCAVGVVKVKIVNAITIDQPPVAKDDIVDVLPGGSTTTLANGAATLLFNDIDPEGDSMQVFLKTNALNGTASILDHASGTFSYTNTVPAINDSFTVKVCDSHGACSTSTVFVNVMHKPTVSKSFSPSSVTLGATSLMTIAIGNPDGDAITGLDIDDLYPGGMINGSGNPVVIDTCNFQQEVVPAFGTSAKLVNGTIDAGGACSVVIEVIGSASGGALNDTGPVPSANAETGDGDAATLLVSNGPTLAEPTVQKTFEPSQVQPGGSAKMTITLTNPNANNAILDAQLNDMYPAPLGSIVNAPGGVVDSDGCGFVEDIPADGDWAKLSGGTIAAGKSCSIVINVVGHATATNTTGAAASLNAQSGASASGTLTVSGSSLLPAPTVTAQFSPLTVATGGSSQMTLTLTNNATDAVTGVNIGDVYPPGGIVNGKSLGNPGSPVESDTCNFNQAAQVAGGSATLTGGTIPAGVGHSCSIVIDVVGAASGNWINQTSTVTSDNATIAPGGQAELQVFDSIVKLQSPAVTQTFVPSSITVGGTSKLKIMLTDPVANALAITGLTLADSYAPAPSHIANEPGATSDCGGALLAAAGDTSLSLSGATVMMDGSCSIQVNVIGTSPGNVTSDIGTITSNNANPGTGPQATLTVINGVLLNPPVVGKAFDPGTISAGDTAAMRISFDNPNANAIDGAQISDEYPAGMLNASGNPIVSDDCGFNEDVPAGGAWSHLDGGTIPPGGCSIVIAVVGTATATNQTGLTLSANAQNGAPASATLTVQNGGGVLTPQTIVFTSVAPNNAKVAGPTYHAVATATSGLPVSLAIDNASATVCTMDNNGIITFVGVGICTIDANQAGDTTYAPAPQLQQSFTVASAGGSWSQTIAFTSMAPNNAAVAGPAYHVTATATSGLPVLLTIDNTSSTVCTIAGGIVSFIGAGMCAIDANQGGDSNYAPAPQLQQSFVVAVAGGQTSQTIHFTSTAPSTAMVAGAPYQPTAAADSGLPVVFTIEGAAANVCTINNGVVTFVGAGTCTIDANQGGDSNYAPAPQVQQSFPVAAAAGSTLQTISFTSTAPVHAVIGGPTYLAVATATSHLPVVLTVDAAAGAVCTINDGTVSFIGAGTCTINANQGGDANYAPAPEVQQSFAVTVAVAPTVLCTLATQTGVVGDAISIDLSGLFAPPASDTLAYSATNLPPSLSITGSLLTGTLQAGDVPSSPYTSTLKASAVLGGGSATEDAAFVVLPFGEILLSDGFDGPDAAPICH
jgi:hypothetical protein